MRILTVGNMYPPHHLGGYELTWRSSVEHLRCSGHEVGVLTTDYRNPGPDPDIAEDPAARRELRWYWREHDFPRLSVRERVALERHNGRVLERALAELAPDVVCWWAMGGMSLSLIERVRRRGLPAVGVVGDVWMLYGPKVDAWMRMARRLGPAGAAAGFLARIPASVDLSDVIWLFNSETTRRHCLGEGLALPRTRIAHPGIDERLFHAAPRPPWRWRLLYVGRIDERKGVDAAVEAMALLPGHAHLTVLGSGDDEFMRRLQATCTRLGLAGRVEFARIPRDRLPSAYAESDALLFPTRWEEPWGLVPLEAMAVGTPVVATGTGGSAEYMRHGDNCLLIDRSAKPDELAAAVTRLAADEQLRGVLREEGFRTAAPFTETAYNEAIESALAAACGQGPTASR